MVVVVAFGLTDGVVDVAAAGHVHHPGVVVIGQRGTTPSPDLDDCDGVSENNK